MRQLPQSDFCQACQFMAVALLNRSPAPEKVQHYADATQSSTRNPATR